MTGSAPAKAPHAGVNRGFPRVGGRAASLAPPSLAQAMVVRPRLHALIDRGIEHRLTLISAPPGSGKTMLLLSWLATYEGRGPVAWLSLAEHSDEQSTFWYDLAAAISGATVTSPAVGEASEGIVIGMLLPAL